MNGPDGVRDKLADALLDILPIKIPLLRQAWNLDDGGMPDVDVVSSGELPDNKIANVGDVWVEVINPRMLPGMRRIDIDPSGAAVYKIRYACRIYSWAKGDGWDDAMLRRDRIAGAVRATLLEFPTLTRAGGDTGYLVHEDTWTEEYGVPSRVGNQSGRAWCTALQSVDVLTEETLSDGQMRPPIGSNLSTIVGAQAIGPDEEIPDDLSPVP